MRNPSVLVAVMLALFVGGATAGRADDGGVRFEASRFIDGRTLDGGLVACRETCVRDDSPMPDGGCVRRELNCVQPQKSALSKLDCSRLARQFTAIWRDGPNCRHVHDCEVAATYLGPNCGHMKTAYPECHFEVRGCPNQQRSECINGHCAPVGEEKWAGFEVLSGSNLSQEPDAGH